MDSYEADDDTIKSFSSETTENRTSFSLLADPEYAGRARAINRLRDLGIDGLEVDGIDGNKLNISLPKIVLVGNQSSGKSSLIEAISQVKVPQGDGTCTRCPIEVRLSAQPGVRWNCDVFLRRHLGNGNVQMYRFASTSDREGVESVLRQAQQAILNPQIDPQLFRTENPPRGMQELFSEDTIVVEITGAHLDITFTDLPGLISSVSTLYEMANILGQGFGARLQGHGS